MGHHHHHHHHDELPAQIGQAFLLNLCFTLIELVGGVLTNSMAILSDAVHDLGDTLSLGLAWYFEKLGQKRRDQHFSYGYKRFSLLAAVINGCILVGGSLFILLESLPRLWSPEPTYVPGMIGLALLGILVNGLAFFRLRGGSSQNARVVSLHLLEDVLGWCAVLVGSLIMLVYPWYLIDVLMAIGIACFILYNALGNLKQSITIFLQVIPAEVDVDGFKQDILALDAVKDIHDLHLWTLDGQQHILTLHIVISDHLEWQAQKEIKQTIKQILKSHHIGHITIEIETESEVCELEFC